MYGESTTRMIYAIVVLEGFEKLSPPPTMVLSVEYVKRGQDVD